MEKIYETFVSVGLRVARKGYGHLVFLFEGRQEQCFVWELRWDSDSIPHPIKSTSFSTSTVLTQLQLLQLRMRLCHFGVLHYSRLSAFLELFFLCVSHPRVG